jgi:hypothetical protein
MLDKIKECLKLERVLYTKHAKDEMESEELGEIREDEVFEAIIQGNIIEDYPDDDPYPSCLIFGRTSRNRPIHVVCAYSADDDIIIMVTVYEPHTVRWVDFERRVK